MKDKLIGESIKKLRKKKKLTLKEVSEKTDLSISFLSQVERMKSSLTLESLKKISDVLGVNPSYFFSSNQNHVEESAIVRSNHEADFRSYQFIYKNLTTEKDNLPYTPILVILKEGENHGKPFSHKGTELIYVLEGVLTIQLESDEYTLYPHDSIVLDSSKPHYWLNYTNETVKFLCISSPA